MNWLDDIGDAASKSFAGDKVLLGALALGAVAIAGVAWWLMGQLGVVDPVFGCVKCEAAKKLQLVLVEFADREGSMAPIRGTRSQYVNLTRFGEGDPQVSTGHQRGRQPPIVVKVSPPMATTVTLRLVRVESNRGFPAGSESLSVKEEKLEYLRWDASVTATVQTDANGEGKLDPGMTLPQTAGFLYHVEGSVAGKPFLRSSSSVLVKRRFAVRLLVRYAAGQAAAQAALQQVRAILGLMDVEFFDLPTLVGDELEICVRDPAVQGQPGQDALDAPDEIKAYNPHSLAIVIGKFAYESLVPQIFEQVEAKVSGRFPPTAMVMFTAGGRGYCTVPLADGSQFMGASVSDGRTTVDLEPSEVQWLPGFARYAVANLGRVMPLLSPAATALTVSIKVQALDAWSIGWAYDKSPVIYLNMHDPYTNNVIAPGQAAALVLHQLGHKLRLTSDGEVGGPDRQWHHYGDKVINGRKHVGRHCSSGVTANIDITSAMASKVATCAMWGALTGVQKFCEECRTTLRKVDLSTGI